MREWTGREPANRGIAERSANQCSDHPFQQDYHYYYTWNFTVTSQSNTIEFEGLVSGKHTALIDELSLVATDDQIVDGSFESPSVAANSYQANPAAHLGRSRPRAPE